MTAPARVDIDLTVSLRGAFPVGHFFPDPRVTHALDVAFVEIGDPRAVLLAVDRPALDRLIGGLAEVAREWDERSIEDGA